MPHQSKFCRSATVRKVCTVASDTVLDFLAPAAQEFANHIPRKSFSSRSRPDGRCDTTHEGVEAWFLTALTQASTCKKHQHRKANQASRRDGHNLEQRAQFSTSALKQSSALRSTTVDKVYGDKQYATTQSTLPYTSSPIDEHQPRILSPSSESSTTHKRRTRTVDWLDKDQASPEIRVKSWFPQTFFDNTFEQRFAQSSRLPPTFFHDVKEIRRLSAAEHGRRTDAILQNKQDAFQLEGTIANDIDESATLESRMQLLKSVRDLEEKLTEAKRRLNSSFISKSIVQSTTDPIESRERRPTVLNKEDYMNLVDLYYYSHNNRFSPEATDLSPSPQFLDDFSFQLSEDFSRPDHEYLNEDESFDSPLQQIHDTLKSRKLREIAVMQVFVDLLLDDASSNRALYEAYKSLPEPGVAFLPRGVIRMFMQRMSTPWTNSEKSMLRYLALIDDMQKANIPITSAEWSSAVYLAGRSFARVTDQDVASAFGVWRQMEREAGVKSSHVTFNILFDIAVRAGKFALGQTILMEMSQRNLRLNRLGRVSLIYYHGLRGDGDGVRKTYRDFVEAGEIVDTLVLNCVIASLLNAQEPTAAEQVYERMKSMFSKLHKTSSEDDNNGNAYYTRYPPPGENTIDREMASNRLGRILLRAPNLQQTFPDHHKELQASMPLIPDFTTFRTMIAHHATKTGDLDRLSVLLHEMTDVFGLPLRSLVFQLLFKGFALHGPTGGPDSQWSVKRLDLCWNAFRDAVKDTRSIKRPHSNGSDQVIKPTLPSIKDINAIAPNAPIPAFDPPLHNPPAKRLSSWNEFVLDLVIFPRERLRRIERFHAQMFDDEHAPKPHESRKPHTFASPFFQSTVYQAPEPRLDHEEGEYVLPQPTDTAIFQANLHLQRDGNHDNNGRTHNQEDVVVNQENSYYLPEVQDIDVSGYETNHGLKSNSDPNPSFNDNEPETEAEHDTPTTHSRTLVAPNRPLICWLLRAYARNTRSRAKVEEIWNSIRKIWQPRDNTDRESVVRVLRRCLRDCDREGSG